MQRITIDPITRLEGHGRIEIFLNEEGDVANTYFQIPELRGFERFCVGRPVEEMPLLTNRICGVCPEAHHMAAAKAADAVYHVEVPRTGKMLRELLYSGFYFTDHTTHFYALGGPDFVMGPTAPVAERNILGVIHKVGLEIGGKVIQARKYGHHIVEIIGGRKVHPCTSIPGGLTKGITEEQRQEIESMGRWGIEFAQFSLQLFSDIVLGNKEYVDLILGDIYTHKTYSMGMVDENNKVNFYDGMVSVVAPDGERLGKYAPHEYTDWIAEHVEPWTYLKFPYLKKVGWKGFVDGKDSGVYFATPLSRLNAADGMATPLAQEHYEKFYTTLGGKPVHQRLAIHWARLIELLYAAERIVELATDPEITSDNYHTVPTATPTEGVGIVEAPRGTLTHHYKTDERGILTEVNLIVGTTNNYAPISMSVNKAASSLIKKGTIVTEGMLNMVEMAFRAYDPCFGCATHSLPGQMPLQVTIYDADRQPIEVLKQFCCPSEIRCQVMQTIVIGLGNPILGDDGAGWKIAEQVAERLAAQPVNREQEIDVACLGVGGLSLMEHLIGYDRAILIDTILTEKSPPGTVYQFPLEQMVGAPTGHLASTHDTTLQNALRVGQTMGAKLPDQITVIAVEAYNVYDFSDELSPPIAQAVNQAVQLVMEQIQ